MKQLLTLSLFTFMYIGSFCQSNSYDGFLFKMDSQQMQRITFPLKISMLGDGTYEIFSQHKNSKLQYSGKYIEYDKWERLYKYRSIRKWYPGGLSRSDNPEFTTETYITSRKNLSDFANGLKIYPDDLNEDYKINIQEITTSKWTEKEVSFYTIMPFNNFKIANTQKRDYVNDSIKKGGPFWLAGRSASSLPKPNYTGNDEGIVVIQVTVNNAGQVTKAEVVVKDSNTADPVMIAAARKAALQARFNADENAPVFQIGNITYSFVLD